MTTSATLVRKVFLNLSVLALTFVIGCLVQFGLRRSEITKTNTPASKRIQAPAGWKRITAGRVSFYVPPEMTPTERVADTGIVLRPNSVDGEYLYLYYAYGKKIPVDVNAIPSESQPVTISGTPAWIRKWQRPEDLPWGFVQPSVQLVVTDVGDGNKFELYGIATGFTTLQGVIDTVEIH